MGAQLFFVFLRFGPSKVGLNLGRKINVFFRFGPSEVGLNLGWGEDLSSSKEFKPIQRTHG